MTEITTPILLDLPEQIETERLILRPYRLDEGDTVHAAIEASREELRPFMMWAMQSREDTEQFIRRSVSNWIKREVLGLGIFRKADGVYIGGTGFHNIDWKVPKFEIGYWQSTPMSGQGYITEAVKAQVEFARQVFGALRIEIWCDVRNVKSANVARRAGFQHFATFINDNRDWNGRLRDSFGFCKTWPEEPAR
jgi:RimJ/RimL family protein N-acetyltransferase